MACGTRISLKSWRCFLIFPVLSAVAHNRYQKQLRAKYASESYADNEKMLEAKYAQRNTSNRKVKLAPSNILRLVHVDLTSFQEIPMSCESSLP